MSNKLYTIKYLEGASKVLLGDLWLRSKEVSLEIVNRGSGGVFNSIVRYRVEELVNPRVENRSSRYCTCVLSSWGIEYRGEILYLLLY